MNVSAFEDAVAELFSFVSRTGLAAPRAKAALEELEKAQRALANLELVPEGGAQALADVRTLDEWAREVGLGTWQLRAGCDGSGADRFIVWIKREATDADGGPDDTGYCDGDWWSKDFDGATPDEARAKAAAWAREQAK